MVAQLRAPLKPLEHYMTQYGIEGFKGHALSLSRRPMKGYKRTVLVHGQY